MDIDTREPFNNDDALVSLKQVHEYFIKRYSDLKGEDVRDLEKLSGELDKVTQFIEQWIQVGSVAK